MINLSQSTKKKLQHEAICWLARLESPQLTPELENEFFHWLQSSPSHQAAYIEAEQLWEKGYTLNQAHRPTNPWLQWFHTKIYLARQWEIITAVPVLTIVLCGCLYLFNKQNELVYNNTFQTVPGEQKQVTLSDGSVLLLNADSKIHVTIDKDKRYVTLEKGEVFFDVTHQAGKPFMVDTDTGLVRVVGTQFSVYKSYEETLVTVAEGRVSLSPDTSTTHTPSSQGRKVETILTANQQLTFKAAQAGVPPKNVDVGVSLAWRNKQLIYRNANLKQVIEDLNRYFKADIQLNDTSLETKEVFAVIQLSGLEETLEALKTSMNLASKTNPGKNQIILYQRQ